MDNNIVILPEYQEVYNRAYRSIRNRVGLTLADVGRNIKVRVIGNGTPITRENGLQVILFNTNAMNTSMLAEVAGMLKPEAFNAAATDMEAAVAYTRKAQNTGSIPFTVPVNNRQASLVGQGATVDCTVQLITLRDGSQALGLNFNRVIPAETATGVSGALDALLADTAVVTQAESSDPFADTTVKPAKPAKGVAA